MDVAWIGRTRWASPVAALLAVTALAAAPAFAVDIRMDVDAGTVVCNGIVAGVADCDLTGAVPAQLTVTWSLDAETFLNGYDLSVQWDPNELALTSSSQLLPDNQPPGTIPFTIAPDPLDPAGSLALTLSLVAFQTTKLFSLSFDVIGTLSANCAADLSWFANGNGLAPGGVVLGNPSGAGVDLAETRDCSDGLDNDSDHFIDFDGGACAGLPLAQQTAPDPQCSDPQDGESLAVPVPALPSWPWLAPLLLAIGLAALPKKAGRLRSSPPSP